MRDFVKKTDQGVLDQIIKLAEDAMVKPFSKKKEIVIEDIGENEDDVEIMSKDDDVSSNISPDDLEELLAKYKKG